MMDERRPEESDDMPTLDVCSSAMLQSEKSEWVLTPYRRRADSLRALGTAMLRSWRRRGEDMRHLEKEAEHFKNQHVQNKSTGRVCKALMQVEHERNGDLHLELMMSKLSTNEIQSSIHSLTADKEKLQHEVESRKREHDELQAVADQRKIELCAAKTQQCLDQNRLSQEEETISQLRRKNADLDTEVATLRKLQLDHKTTEQYLTKDLEGVTERMNTLQEELSYLQDRARGWNS
ncbi:uncharacterized protein LOC111073502 [Drosophila obscura]|uniref:uncharacterized protein LOC111073502 n=1 Tax=Drosophila obscura TaxID=7282 RepID=UPI000BA06ADE|nr:uncharacterized protein LOC111073502 [Drosophila obscura]